MELRNREYCVVLILVKDLAQTKDYQIYQGYVETINEDEAINLTLRSDPIISFFKEGYSICSKSASMVPVEICLYNGSFDIVRGFDKSSGIDEWLFINLASLTEENQTALQSLLQILKPDFRPLKFKK